MKFDEREVKARLKESVDFLMSLDPKKLDDMCKEFPEVYCKSCGRSVLVGRCCHNPDIKEVK